MFDSLVPDDLITRRVNDTEWLIENRAFPPDDARHLVAFVHEDRDHAAEVIWVQGFGLPRSYARSQDILQDAARWMAREHRSTRPIHIPHFAPAPRAAGARR